MVTIIIPLNKDRGFLNKAIESVENQTYKDIQLIIEQSPNTVGYNLNKGLNAVKGDFWCFLCDDDTLPPDSIESRLEFIKSTPFDLIHTKAEWDNGNHYDLTNPYSQFNSVLQNNGIHGGTVFYRSETTLKYRFDENLTTAEEWDFNLKLLFNGLTIGYLDKSTYIYRRHSNQKSIGNLSPEYQLKRQQTKNLIRERYTPNSPTR